MQQLPLDIEIKADATFSNFVSGGSVGGEDVSGEGVSSELLDDGRLDKTSIIVNENAQLVSVLKAISREAGSDAEVVDRDINFVYLYGEEGTGRTHLLQAFTQSYSEYSPSGLIAYLPLDNPQLVPEMLEGLSSFDAVCLDGLEHVLGDKAWEEAMFNVYNQLKEQGKTLIISGREAPSQLTVALQDLKSRLSAMLIHSIQPLSDDGKRLLLKRKAQERGLELTSDVASFLLSRQQRDLPSLLKILEQLDQASLQAKRRLTIPFVKEVLDL